MIQQTVKQMSAMIRIPFSAPFLPLAMEFGDKGARGLGYGDRETGGLVLAVEELFAFYVRQAAADFAGPCPGRFADAFVGRATRPGDGRR